MVSIDDWPNVDFNNAESVARFEEFAERRRDILLEINATYYERGTAYTNLIILAGYAGAFSVWAFVKDSALSDRGSAEVGFFLSISLMIFVIFEIYKMITSSLRSQRVGSLLREQSPPLKFLADMRELRNLERRDNLTRMNRWWAINVAASVLFSIPAIGMLLYAMIAIPLGWPKWP